MVDLDAAGGAATGGLLAGAIERPTGHAGDAHGDCTDCGAPVEGNFCSNCGQPTHVHRTLLHLGEEILHGALHFDARIWRTLPLLAINPGRLTREWVQGRRTRYVSPLAMFLFTVFLMFFVFSFTGALNPKVETNLSAEQRAALIQQLQEARADVSEARAEGDAVSAAAFEAVAAGLERQLGDQAPAGPEDADGVPGGSWRGQQVRDALASGDLKVDTGWKSLDKILTKKLVNPELALYKIQQTAYKFSFLLIPISIPFVALLFLWRRGFTLYDHGVFVLYSLTAMSILFMVISILGPLWVGFGLVGGLLVVFGIPAHMFAQLKGAYGLGWFSAAWRTVLLLIFAGVALLLFILAIVALGLTG